MINHKPEIRLLLGDDSPNPNHIWTIYGPCVRMLIYIYIYSLYHYLYIYIWIMMIPLYNLPRYMEHIYICSYLLPILSMIFVKFGRIMGPLGSPPSPARMVRKDHFPWSKEVSPPCLENHSPITLGYVYYIYSPYIYGSFYGCQWMLIVSNFVIFYVFLFEHVLLNYFSIGIQHQVVPRCLQNPKADVPWGPYPAVFSGHPLASFFVSIKIIAVNLRPIPHFGTNPLIVLLGTDAISD